MAHAQIVKWDNSLAVRIPKPVAEQAGVREGDPIVIEAAKGQTFKPRRKRRIPTLHELVPDHGRHALRRNSGRPTTRKGGG